MSLIPVNKLAGMAQIADGYMFNTETSQLLSNKNGFQVQLYGSFNGRQGTRRYTLQYKPEYKNYRNKSISVKHSEIEKLAIVHEKNVQTTKCNLLVEAVKSTKLKVQTKGWLIGSILDGVIKTSSHPKVHDTEDGANKEIERLAVTNKGQTFVKLKIENFVVSGGVQWS